MIEQKGLMDRATYRDIIAIIILISCFILIGIGKDHGIMAILTAVAGYYFGRREKVNEIVNEKIQKRVQ